MVYFICKGVMEERLPFAYISFPPWFERLYPEAVNNIRHNARKLTSPFDLYETLKDLRHPDERLSREILDIRVKTEIRPKIKRRATTTEKPASMLTLKEINALKKKKNRRININSVIEIENNLVYIKDNGNPCKNMKEVTSDSKQNNCTYSRKYKGISLFLPIPTYRTCEDAGIPPHYCTCQVIIQLHHSFKSLKCLIKLFFYLSID